MTLFCIHKINTVQLMCVKPSHGGGNLSWVDPGKRSGQPMVAKPREGSYHQELSPKPSPKLSQLGPSINRSQELCQAKGQGEPIPRGTKPQGSPWTMGARANGSWVPTGANGQPQPRADRSQEPTKAIFLSFMLFAVFVLFLLVVINWIRKYILLFATVKIFFIKHESEGVGPEWIK